MEKQNLVATATTSIQANADKVWEAMINPEMIRQYMFGTTVTSDWKEGSAITWKGEMKGKLYEDKGVIVTIIPQKKLAYTHYSPLSGLPDEPASYHTVTIQLNAQKDTTNVVLTQDKNDSEKAKDESEKNWNTMLEGLKKLLEK